MKPQLLSGYLYKIPKKNATSANRPSAMLQTPCSMRIRLRIFVESGKHRFSCLSWFLLLGSSLRPLSCRPTRCLLCFFTFGGFGRGIWERLGHFVSSHFGLEGVELVLYFVFVFSLVFFGERLREWSGQPGWNRAMVRPPAAATISSQAY